MWGILECMSTSVTREQVLAHRIRAQGLHRDAGSMDDLAVLDLGVQDATGDTAALALANRLSDPDAVDTGALRVIWSFRGAPHLHRPDELHALARALWPRDDEDAAHRVTGYSLDLQAAGLAGLAAFRTAAEAVAEVVQEPLSKGEVSTAVTQLVPEGLTSWCRGCGTTHVFDQVLRAAALPAGAAIEPGRSPLTLTPLPDWPGPPSRMRSAGEYLMRYLRLHGPAGMSEAGNFLGMSGEVAQRALPKGLAEVSVEGRKRWLPEAALADLRAAEPEPIVRLLPRSDPYLQARDRNLLVADKARQKEIWRILGNPGAVLSGTEIVGVWRMKTSGRSRLQITVQPFQKLSAAVRKQIETEAQRVAVVRGRSEVEIEF